MHVSGRAGFVPLTPITCRTSIVLSVVLEMAWCRGPRRLGHASGCASIVIMMRTCGRTQIVLFVARCGMQGLRRRRSSRAIAGGSQLLNTGKHRATPEGREHHGGGMVTMRLRLQGPAGENSSISCGNYVDIRHGRNHGWEQFAHSSLKGLEHTDHGLAFSTISGGSKPLLIVSFLRQVCMLV